MPSSISFTKSLALPFILLNLTLLPPAMAIDSTAEAYAQQASHCYQRGEIWKAAILYQKALRNEVPDANDELYMASLHNNLGECYRRLIQDPGQRSRYEQDAPQDDQEDNKSPKRGDTNDFLERAKFHLEKALEIKERLTTNRTDFIYIARGLENLARVYLDQNNTTESEALYRRAIKIRESKEGKDSPSCASAYLGIADNLALGGKNLYPEAESNYRKAMSLFRIASGPTDPTVGKCHQQLSLLYFKWNKLIQSGTEYDTALSIYKRNLPKTKANIDNLKYELRDIPTGIYGQLGLDLKSYSDRNETSGPKYINLLRLCQSAALRTGDPGNHAAFFAKQIAEAQKKH